MATYHNTVLATALPSIYSTFAISLFVSADTNSAFAGTGILTDSQDVIAISATALAKDLKAELSSNKVEIKFETAQISVQQFIVFYCCCHFDFVVFFYCVNIAC